MPVSLGKKVESTYFFKTLVPINKTTWHHIAETIVFVGFEGLTAVVRSWVSIVGIATGYSLDV
jgi:hypothetical protein